MRDGSKVSGRNSANEKSSVWKDCLFATRLYFAGNSLYFVLNALLVFFGAVLPAVGALISKPLVDSAIRGAGGEVFKFAAVILLIYLLEPLAENLHFYLTGMLKEGVEERALLTVAGALDNVSTLEVFDSPAYHDAVSVLRFLGSRVSFAVYGVITLATVLVRGLSFLYPLWRVNPWIPAVVILAGLPRLLLAKNMMNVSWNGLISRAPESRRLSYLQELIFQEQTAQEVRLFGIVSYLKSKYSELFHRTLQVWAGVYKKRLSANLILALCSWGVRSSP